MALKSIDSEAITVDATAGGVSFTSATLTGQVLMASCRLETGPVRINTINAPTAGGSEGSLLKNIGDEFEIWGSDDLKNFRAIRTTSTSGTLAVIYQGTGA